MHNIAKRFAQIAAWLSAATCLVLVGVGCSSTPAAFATHYADNKDADIELILQRINAASAREADTIAVGITAAPTNLYAYDVSDRKLLWRKPINATTAPFLAGELAVVQVANEVVGFDLRTGNKRVSFDLNDMSLKAAAGDGSVAVIVIGRGQGTFAQSTVVLVHNGAVAWRRDVDKLVGVPAVVGSMVLVPWSNQFLSAIDVQSGDEFARVRVNDGVIAHAFRDGEHVYVGSSHGITRVNSSIGSGTLQGAGYFKLPNRDLPGRPMLLSDIYAASSAPTPDSAQHRIALTWRPTAPDKIRIELQDSNLYLIFYRLVFALNPSDYALRWVYLNAADIVGARAQAHGVAIADEAGRFAFLGAGSGEPLWSADSGARSSVVRLPEGGSGVNDGGPVLPPDALPGKIMIAALDQDSRLVPARVLAIQQLAALSVAEATADLIELCDSSRVAPSVREEACSLLKGRSIGADHLMEALERHAGFLEGTTSPPVGALAKAAASLNEKRAVGLLVGHLKDPNTRSSDLPSLVSALADLGDAAATEPLTEFLRLYHADAADEYLLRALELVPAALVKLSGPVAQPTLEAVMYDEMGVYAVRDKAREAVDGLNALQASAQKTDEQQQVDQEHTVATEIAADGRSKFLPRHLSLQLIDEALLPVRDALRDCLTKAPKPTYQARIVLVVEDGKVNMVSVLPAELQACIEPLVRGQAFARTESGQRESLVYTLKR